MTGYILIFLSLVAGVLAGLWAGFSIVKGKPSEKVFVKDSSRIYVPERELQKKYLEEEVPEEKIVESESTEEIQQETVKTKKSLKEKIQSRKKVASVLEMGCIAENRDYSNTIHKNRNMEDDAYNILKKMKEEKKASKAAKKESVKETDKQIASLPIVEEPKEKTDAEMIDELAERYIQQQQKEEMMPSEPAQEESSYGIPDFIQNDADLQFNLNNERVQNDNMIWNQNTFHQQQMMNQDPML